MAYLGFAGSGPARLKYSTVGSICLSSQISPKKSAHDTNFVTLSIRALSFALLVSSFPALA